jgi:hypothetical protein
MSLLRTVFTWYQSHKDFFEVTALSASLTGILFALKSVHDGRKMTKDLRAVFDQLTTRALGPYPAYMIEIERLIAEARDGVMIACDFPGYGAWADRGRYSSYLKALENRKADRVRRSQHFSVRLLTLDAASRRRELDQRFPEAAWKDYVKKGGYAHSRRLYEELESCKVPETRSAFLVEMAVRQERALTADLRFAQCREMKGLLPMHFWIADDKRAVFVIPGGRDGQDFGFVTEDVGLVQGLIAIFERYADETQVAEGRAVA